MFAKVDKTSVQYEDAQQQARQCPPRGGQEICRQANSLARSDSPRPSKRSTRALEDIDPG